MSGEPTTETDARGCCPVRGSPRACPRSVPDRTRLREGRRPGSIPGEDTEILTLEPDGTATGCNPVQVGSTPTGVSDRPTADPDYIDFGSRKVSGTELRRRVAVHTQLPAGTTSRLITWCQTHRCPSKPSLGLVFRHRANRRRGKRVACSAQLPAGTTSTTIATCLGKQRRWVLLNVEWRSPWPTRRCSQA